MIGHLFPVLDYWWFYAAFTGLVVAFLALDLGVFHRKTHVIGFREASAWTAVWAGLALLFCVGLYKYAVWNFGATTGEKIGVEFLTGYVVEWSLSLDNMFVFALVFRYFGTPALLQHRILFYGILGALIFRGVFVVLGTELLQYGWMVILFGVFLILTGIQMMFPRSARSNRNKALSVGDCEGCCPWCRTLKGHVSSCDGMENCSRHLCDHPRAVGRLHVERIRHSGPARDVFSSGRCPRDSTCCVMAWRSF